MIDVRNGKAVLSVRSSVEGDALRVAVEAPEEALAWLDPVLFTEGPFRRRVRARCVPIRPCSKALDAIDHDDPDAADLLRQAAAEQSDATIGGVFLRLSQEAARRVLVDLRQGRTAVQTILLP